MLAPDRWVLSGDEAATWDAPSVPGLSIEPMTPVQWPRVRAIRLSALREAPDAFWTTLEQERSRTAAEWRARLDRADRTTLLAVLDETDVGIAVGAPHHDGGRDAGLYSVWVAPEVRGCGVSDVVVSAVISWAIERGHQRLRLEVADDNHRAVRLYERYGFVPTGATSRFPPPRDHVVEHERVLELRRP